MVNPKEPAGKADAKVKEQMAKLAAEAQAVRTNSETVNLDLRILAFKLAASLASINR